MTEQVQNEEFVGRPSRRRPGEFKYVRFRTEGPVARMTLDRPEHNLLNEPMLRELAGVEPLGEMDEVKLAVLDSACKVFSGGIDIGEYTADRVFQMLDAFHSAFTAMLEVSKPVLVIVNGPAIGGGAELAAFGDLVLATPKARFAQPEITIGVFPPLASTILPHIVGPKVALELVLTGEPISAERARELGLVNRLVPESQLERAVGGMDSANHFAIRSRADDGQARHPRRHGPFPERWPAPLHEHFPERALPSRGFAGRPAGARRKAQAALEESLRKRST